jgi:hypothetical protein
VSITFLVPVRTTNASNQQRGNSRWAAIARTREDAERRQVAVMCTRAAMLRASLRAADLVPCVVTLTRISPGSLDRHDGLPASQKRVVDGIAEALGIDDGGPFVEWRYQQLKAGRGVYGTRVEIERRA